eukprot:6735718-Prymnesium_polylepis.2
MWASRARGGWPRASAAPFVRLFSPKSRSTEPPNRYGRHSAAKSAPEHGNGLKVVSFNFGSN